MATRLKIWSRFSVTRDGETIKFRTIEPPLDRMNDITDLFFNYLATEEPLYKASGMPNNEEALAEYKEYFIKTLTDGSMHTVICCLDNDDDEIGEIIGGSFVAITYKDKAIEIPFQPKTTELLKAIQIMLTIKNMFDVCTELNVDKYYRGKGLVVHPKYRGYGIARELLKTRRLVCEKHNVPLSVAFMTAYGSQKAAERDNWQTVYEFSFEDFGKELGVSFEGCPTTVKLMATRPL